MFYLKVKRREKPVTRKKKKIKRNSMLQNIIITWTQARFCRDDSPAFVCKKKLSRDLIRAGGGHAALYSGLCSGARLEHCANILARALR